MVYFMIIPYLGCNGIAFAGTSGYNMIQPLLSCRCLQTTLVGTMLQWDQIDPNWDMGLSENGVPLNPSDSHHVPHR